MGKLLSDSVEGLESAIQSAEYFINKGYLDFLSEYEPLSLPQKEQSLRYMRLCKLEKIVYDKNEDISDKLISVYGALSQFVNNVVLLLIGEPKKVSIYLGVRSKSHVAVAEGILMDSFVANFPGSSLVAQTQDELSHIIETSFNNTQDDFSDESGLSIEFISVTPSLRGEKRETFVQGLEKFIDTMRGEEYVCEIIATPMNRDQADSRRRGLEEIAAALSPFEKTTLAQGETDTRTLSEGVTDSVSTTISKGVSLSTGTSTGYSKGKSTGFNLGASFLVNFGLNNSQTDTVSNGKTSNEIETSTEGTQTGQSTQVTRADAKGTTETCTTEYKNKAVEQLLKRIDLNLERLNEGESYGLWDCAAYMIAQRKKTVAIASGTFKSLMLGEKSNADRSHVNFVSAEKHRVVNSILSSLRYFEHPCFKVPAQGLIEEQAVYPTNMVNGHELPLFLSLPRHSVPGVVVTEMASFGRNVLSSSEGRKIDIGKIFYMDSLDQSSVNIDVDSLTSHCFITGSTGCGKSNTVYCLLESLGKLEPPVPFLVIEPAKGEYRKHFAKYPNIQVFGTNAAHAQLLKINPFRFPASIHILEHLDRLVEIFNACWEMYAAMPAILKEAIECAYISKGWDLLNSVYTRAGTPEYPTFSDLLYELPKVIKQSSYSSDTQGDYTGALVTRVNSLTNGIYGQIFCDDFDIEEEILFDGNTIVDLSRVGSAETKSLIMGMLVLRLTEYRMSSDIPMNSTLRHVTVLEEAHNLLKNTQNQIGTAGNQVVAKSVEMIVSSIAEMRTYGEGFLIVDQSPTAVDVAAIKNTNTKIVMRLPERDDCQIIGRAVAIKDEQIEELSRLKVGKAVVMQSNWTEAVQAQIYRADDRYECTEFPLPYETLKDFRSQILTLLLREFALTDNYDTGKILDAIDRYNIRDASKAEMRRLINRICPILKQKFDSILFGRTVMRLSGCSDMFRISAESLVRSEEPSGEAKGINYTKTSVQHWRTNLTHTLKKYVDLDEDCEEILMRYLIYVQQFEKQDIDYRTLYRDIYEIR